MQNRVQLTSKPSEKVLLKLDYLNDLSKGNKNFEKKMIGHFINQVPAEMEALNLALMNNDYRAAYKHSHSLIQMVAIMGLDELVPLLSEIETESGNQQLPFSLREKYMIIKDVLQSYYPAFRNYYLNIQ